MRQQANSRNVDGLQPSPDKTPADGRETTAWGELTVFVGVLVPPNPCGETLQEATIAVCGVIRNPCEEELESIA